MQQCLHLLVVDPTRDLVLTDWHQGRWLLPVFSARERARVGYLATRTAARRGIIGQVVGQWLGRVSICPDVVDSLVVIRTQATSRDSAASTWTSPRSLRAAVAVVEYQHWALEKMLTTDGRPRVPGPFGDPDWPDAVHSWVEAVAGGVHCDDTLTYRMAAHAVVMRLSTLAGPLYFKGLSSAAEATLTMALSEMAPHSFAQTHALERRPGGVEWWLTNECPGRTLTSDPTIERAILVAEECGRLQRSLPASVLDRLTSVDLDGTADWSITLLRTLGSGPDVDRCCARIDAACRNVTRARAPVAWIPLDLDPSNVILDDRQVRFIDLDESYRGPAPLAAATFVRRFRRLGRNGAVAGFDRSIWTAYERGLGRPARAETLQQAFDVVSTLLETHAGWLRFSRNVERGEIHAPLEAIEGRVAERLMRVLSA